MSIPVYANNALRCVCMRVLIPNTLARSCFRSSSIFHFCYTQLCSIVYAYIRQTSSVGFGTYIKTKICTLCQSVRMGERVDAFVCYNPKIAAYSIEWMPTPAVDMRLCVIFFGATAVYIPNHSTWMPMLTRLLHLYSIFFGSQHDKRVVYGSMCV